MSYKISPKDLSCIKLNETDTIASVIQNVAIILATFQGSIPLYRNFGLSKESVDKPIPVAKTMLIAQIEEAIADYEPRAVVLGITFIIDESVPGKLIPIVEVEITDE